MLRCPGGEVIYTAINYGPTARSVRVSSHIGFCIDRTRLRLYVLCRFLRNFARVLQIDYSAYGHDDTNADHKRGKFRIHRKNISAVSHVHTSLPTLLRYESFSSETMRPSSILTRRCAFFAYCSSCVTMMIVWPR